MFGSERLIREYRTSEDMSHFHSTYHPNGLKLYSDDPDKLKIYPENSKNENFDLIPRDSQSHFKKHSKNVEAVTEELKLEDLNPSKQSEDESDEKALSIQNQLHEILAHHYQHNEDDFKADYFMDTNELLDLFTSEGIKKTIESGDRNLEHTITLFDKNPFKDFTMTKMNEILKDKNFDEIQELRKLAVDYRATVEHKLLDKMELKESPKTLKTRRIELEKWVDHEIKQIENDTDIEDVKQNAINMICDTNLYTDRVFSFLQKLNSNQTGSSNTHKYEKLTDRNTIEELLKTDSDPSPFTEGLKKFKSKDS